MQNDGSVSVILGATHYDRSRGPGLTTTDFSPTDVQLCPMNGIPLGASR